MQDIPTGRNLRVTDPERYEIRVTGHLARRWAAFFDGMTLTPQDDGTTVIHGPVADQSALHGLLRKLSDLGLPLVSVKPTEETQPTAPPIPADRPVPGPNKARSTT
ncbi:MAG TPA: hypothetical protein VGH11_13100 [Jatrophihabitans sp.]